MFHPHPCLVAILTGFISGFILSVPVGPVNLAIVNEGARRGLIWALLIGYGAVLMEVIYCALAFTGAANFFDGKLIKAILELTTFVFILYLGIRFLTASKVATEGPVGIKLRSKLHPHSAFATGFILVLGNPGVFLFWIFLAATFRAHDWVEATKVGTASCVAGVAGGTSVWFSGLSYAVSRGHGKFTNKTLIMMERVSGICLLVLAFGEGVHIVMQIAEHKL